MSNLLWELARASWLSYKTNQDSFGKQVRRFQPCFCTNMYAKATESWSVHDKSWSFWCFFLSQSCPLVGNPSLLSWKRRRSKTTRCATPPEEMNTKAKRFPRSCTCTAILLTKIDKALHWDVTWCNDNCANVWQNIGSYWRVWLIVSLVSLLPSYVHGDMEYVKHRETGCKKVSFGGMLPTS